MLKFKKLKFKKFISVFIIIFLLVVPIVVIPLLKNLPNPLGYVERPDGSVFIELWNVDTFEGGSANRGAFLENTAIEFEKENRGIYILVKNLTEQQAKLQLENNIKPDIVSFGLGVGDLFLPYLTELSVSKIKTDLIQGGKIDGKQMAMPWCMGGYVLCSQGDSDLNNINAWITETDTNFLGYGGAYINPLSSIAHNKSDVKLNRNIVYSNSLQDSYTQYDAYQDFLDKKFEVLLGTQRDYFRLQNRINAGVMNCNFRFLSGYSDLLQWISVISNEGAVVSMAQTFIEYLLSVNVQKKLISIGMFSVTDELIYINDKTYSQFEQTLKNVDYVQNAFLSKIELQSSKQDIFNKLFN